MKIFNISIASVLTALIGGGVCGLIAYINPVLGLASLPIAALIGKAGACITKGLIK
jgi:hypothetical protein